MCRKNVFLCVIMGFLIAFLWSCASSPKGASEPGKKVSTPPKEESWSTPAGKQTPTSRPATQQDTQTHVKYYVHTVKWAGETISIIASWYTGDIQNWKMLVEANPDINPNVVVAGQEINIPEHIMTTRSPMTKAHVDHYYHKPGKQRTRSSSSGTKDEAPTLYGPK
jgi:hypothetical protein